MEPHRAPQHELDALDEGRAFVDLSAYRKVRVTGTDARAWLGDLITSGVASLEPGASQRSLLLTPTGKIRADLTVAMDREGFLLLQAPDQPDPVIGLLAKYVLSSDVTLEDVGEALSLFAVPGDGPVDPAGATALKPSVLGAGVDLVTAAGAPSAEMKKALAARGLVEAGPDAAETWRIRRGVARMGPDFAQDALPAEAGLDGAIDATKGCFLGQESVARVRNLGHPPTVLRLVTAAGGVEAGAAVRAGDSPVGEITSAAFAPDGRIVAFIRVRWDAQGGPWVTEGGVMLDPTGPTD